MKAAVRYYTKGGNTRKLAEAIAEALECEAKEIQNGATEEADVLFLGASVYWNGIDGKMRSYIDSLDATRVKEVAVFSTSALRERAFPDIKKRLEAKGIKVSDANFYCRGSFMALHVGRPNAKDLEEAKAFARKVMGK